MNATLAFRVTGSTLKSPEFGDPIAGTDIRCGNWYSFDANQQLSKNKNKARHHTRGNPMVPNGTNFISLYDSPRRLWNIARHTKGSRIAVIDLRVLDRLGIAYASTTTDLGFHGVSFATNSHLLVKGWLPARSILGFLAFSQFERLLQIANIDTKTLNWRKCIIS